MGETITSTEAGAAPWFKRIAARFRALPRPAGESPSKTPPTAVPGANAPDVGAGGAPNPQSSRSRSDGRLRCLVICVARPEDLEPYRALASSVHSHGVTAFEALLPLSPSAMSPRPSERAAKRSQTDHRQGSAERFWVAWQSGQINLPYWPCTVNQAYRAYLTWCRRTADPSPLVQDRFTRGVLRISQAEGHICQTKVMSLTDGRGVKKSERMLLNTEPPARGQGVWATECRSMFEKELRKYIRENVSPLPWKL